MKRFIQSLLFVVLSVVLVSCSNSKADTAATQEGISNTATAEKKNQLAYDSNEVGESLPVTTVEWDRLKEDFGSVKAGEVLETKFTLTNTGDQPLIITDAKSTCGCTVPTVEKNVPIAPGKSTVIGVQFNTKGKSGLQSKPINIFANVEGGKTNATIVAQVEGDPAANPPVKQ